MFEKALEEINAFRVRRGMKPLCAKCHRRDLETRHVERMADLALFGKVTE